MFKNYSNCTNCIHTEVCQYKFQLKEIYDKLGGHWANLDAPDIFKLELECSQFKANESIRNNPFNY